MWSLKLALWLSAVSTLCPIFGSRCCEVSKLMHLALWQLKLLHGPTLLKEGILKDRSKVLEADWIESSEESLDGLVMFQVKEKHWKKRHETFLRHRNWWSQSPPWMSWPFRWLQMQRFPDVAGYWRKLSNILFASRAIFTRAACKIDCCRCFLNVYWDARWSENETHEFMTQQKKCYVRMYHSVLRLNTVHAKRS